MAATYNVGFSSGPDNDWDGNPDYYYCNTYVDLPYVIDGNCSFGINGYYTGMVNCNNDSGMYNFSFGFEAFQSNTPPTMLPYIDRVSEEIAGDGVTISSPVIFGEMYANSLFTDGSARGLEIDSGVMFFDWFE